MAPAQVSAYHDASAGFGWLDFTFASEPDASEDHTCAGAAVAAVAAHPLGGYVFDVESADAFDSTGWPACFPAYTIRLTPSEGSPATGWTFTRSGADGDCTYETTGSISPITSDTLVLITDVTTCPDGERTTRVWSADLFMW